MLINHNYKKDKYILKISIDNHEFAINHTKQFDTLEEVKIWLKFLTNFSLLIKQDFKMTKSNCVDLMSQILDFKYDKNLFDKFSMSLQNILKADTQQLLIYSFTNLISEFNLLNYDNDMYSKLGYYEIYYIEQELIYNEIQI